jgi:carbon-monoxide dehydrogenase large subunit
MAEINGLGKSMKRKEDARFIQGKGNYIEDIVLPGMIWLDIVRSPYAHARIVNIDTSKAAKIPGVLGFITGKDLEKYNLHWMPTLMSDRQMVLPTDTVKYQAQEVVGVLATDRYAAADGVAAVEIDYEPLPVVVDPFKALQPGAPKVREDKDSNPE